jgi:hypothetical protein
MIPNEAIEKAKAGGWSPESTEQPWQVTAFDRTFWQGLVRATGHKDGWLPCAAVFFEMRIAGNDMKVYWKDVFKM